MNERYYSLNRYLRETFGEKVYKLALDAGMTCPNRDGTIGTGGCIFCSAGGSGDFAEGRCGSVAEQLERAKGRLRGKTGAEKFIAYFQSYTNTYAPVEYLEKLFSEAMAEESVVALSIGTRPDCLPEEVVALLEKLNRVKPVWVELGLQTIHPETARYIRRGYDLHVYEDALRRLKAAGLTVIVHVILGLPGETREMMLATIDYLAGPHRPDGIKLQLQLDPVRPVGPGQVIDGREHHLPRLPGQSQDHMDDNREPCGLQAAQGILVDMQVIAPPDIPGRLRMDGLQPQLHPHGLHPVQLFQQRHHLLRKAVRPGADGQGHDRLLCHGLRKKLFQILHRGVGVGVGLKIGDELFRTGLPPEPSLRPLELLRNAPAAALGKVPGAARGAEDAPAGADRPVPVGAGHPSVQGQLVDLLPESLPEIPVQGIIAFVQVLSSKKLRRERRPRRSDGCGAAAPCPKIYRTAAFGGRNAGDGVPYISCLHFRLRCLFCSSGPPFGGPALHVHFIDLLSCQAQLGDHVGLRGVAVEGISVRGDVDAVLGP